jgi:hypothetical protein
MGIVNLYRGLESEREIFNFEGKLKDNLDIDWDHAEIIKNGEKLSPDYELQENEVLIIQEIPGITTAAIILGIVALGVGIGVGIYAYDQAKKAQREMEEALKRVGKDNRQKDVSSIPQLADARNEKADGKSLPIILGKHLFAPYYLSEPYMRPGGTDGIDLYWYGTFIVGQSGLCFEKIRNGTTTLLTMSGNEPQRGKSSFQNPGGTNPPFYSPENFIEIAQKGNASSLNQFTETVFEQKWSDSLESTVELARKKKDGAKIGIVENGAFKADENGMFIDDDGEEPIIRATARHPMRAEIEIRLDGLYSWDSENGVATSASVDIELAWSKTDSGPWTALSSSQWPYRNLTRSRATQMRFLAEIDFPSSVFSKGGDPVYIRAIRKTRMHTGTYRSNAFLTAIRTKQYNPNTSSSSNLVAAKNINERAADKFCRMGIKIKANINTQEFMDRFCVIASMTGRTWNGGWSSVKTKTSNSAAVLLELITGLIHDPSKHADQELDLNAFGKLYEFCASRKVEIEGQGIQNLTLECNGVLTSGTRKIDAINSVLATCDGGLYINEFGKLEVYYEDTQIVPIALLNSQRIIKDSMVDQRSLDRITDGYAVEFVDQDADWSQKTYRILRPDIAVNPGLNTYSPMKLDFTTGYNQAMWHARRLLAKERHRPGEVKFKMGREGRYCKPGSLVKVQHERFKIGLGSGEIVSLVKNGNQIVGLKLMEKFDISNERDYWVDFYVVDGDRNRVVTRKIQSVGERTDTLLFTDPLEDENAPEYGNILSAMYGEGLNTGKVWEAKRYIVADLSEIPSGYELALAEYAEDIYRTGPIQDRVSSILNAPPMVFTDQQLRDYQLMLEALRGQTTPQAIDRVAREVFNNLIGPAIAEGIPKFRGVFYVAGLANGTINGVKMNVGDWVYYAGPDGAWSQYYVYQWTATGWVLRPRPSQNPEFGWLYLDAVSSIAQGSPVGTFSDVFCIALTSVTAFIRNLYAQTVNSEFVDVKTRLRIGSGNYYIEIDGQNRWMQSSNFVTGVSGWRLYPDGTAEFANGIFRAKLRIGDAWTDSGAVNNRAARGSVYITDQRLTGTNYEVRIKNLNAYGETNIGLDHGSTTSKTIIFGRLSRSGNEITIMDNVRSLSGDYTASALYSLLNSKYSSEGSYSGPMYPINGSMFYDSSLYTVSYLEHPTSITYEIRGIKARLDAASGGGLRCRIVVTSSQILIYAVSSSGNSSLSETISGSDKITADFIFL